MSTFSYMTCSHLPSTTYCNYRASLARGHTLFFQAMRRKEPPTYCRRAVLVFFRDIMRHHSCQLSRPQ
jgi:hypothetical protein